MSGASGKSGKGKSPRSRHGTSDASTSAGTQLALLDRAAASPSVTAAATPRTAGWRIKTLTLRNFRGIAGEQTFRFGATATLLFGTNGVGKSTVAQGIQWTLYGQLPSGVLPARPQKADLQPVTADSSPSFGQLLFARGEEELTLTRDLATKSFVVTHAAKAHEDAEAERCRDALLGLDADTFARTVLLQQSRIRGLLLDEVKERNRALDRLLGMHHADEVLAALDHRGAAKAATAWHDAIAAATGELEAEGRLLLRQREEALAAAREKEIPPRLLTPSGLKEVYAGLDARLQAVARKYGVTVDPLPAVATTRDTGPAARALRAALQRIRLDAKSTTKLVEAQRRRATLAALSQQWEEVLRERDAAANARDELIRRHGDVQAAQAQLEREAASVARLEAELKAAHALRQLLVDAHAVLAEAAPKDRCPVCEQPVAAESLLAALHERAHALASDSARRLTQELQQRRTQLLGLESTLTKLQRAVSACAERQSRLDELRQKVAVRLATTVLEGDVAAALGRALTAAAADEAAADSGAAELTQELAALEERLDEVVAVLVPVIRSHEQLHAHEQRSEAARLAQKDYGDKALAMERLAGRLESIKHALLRAKHEVAQASLDRAIPRAQELYTRLVRHPVFDRFSIGARERTAKVDYTFAVSASGRPGSERDARQVLSDGQLTAAALALFYALAESSAHALDLLYVDDPTQNLDKQHKQAMAGVVAELARHKQIVVSTHDEELVTYLRDAGFATIAVEHQLCAWSGRPEVVTRLPSTG